MSIVLQIDNYQPIQDYLSNLSLSLRPEYFTPKSQIEIYSPLWSVYSSYNKNKIAPAEWGMMPNWDRKKLIPKPLTVARLETLHERVSFKSLMRRYRALILVNAVTVRSLGKNINNVYNFYKVKNTENKALALAALYQFNIDGNMQVVLITQSLKVPLLKRTLRLPLVVCESDAQMWLSTEKKNLLDSMLVKSNLEDLEFSKQHN